MLKSLKLLSAIFLEDTLSPDITGHMDYVHKRQAMELELETQQASKIEDIWIDHYEKMRELNDEYTNMYKGENISTRAEEEKKALDAFTSQATEDFKELELMIGGWAKSSSDAIAAFAVDGSVSFSDMVKSMIKDMISLLVYQKLMKPLFSSIGGVSGGGEYIDSWRVPSKHSGGIVGTSGGSYRNVSPLVFANAPRLHNGLAADEFPAILQRGEGVISKRDMKSGGSDVIVNINNYSGQQVTQKQGQDPGGKRKIDVMIGSAFSGGKPGNKMLEQVYGLTPRGRY